MDFDQGGNTTGILKKLSAGRWMGPSAQGWVSLIESMVSHKDGEALASHVVIVVCLP